MSIAQPFLESSDQRTAGAYGPSPSVTAASATHATVVADGTGLACSGSDAVVHKRPFAPIQLDEEPTHKNVFRHGSHTNHCPKGSRHRSKAVRVFIGPISTAWMQGHKRWWAKTAEKLE
ncbi:hypothetical protein GGI13_007320, partial [Coemansia sp. RSA 455]